MNIADAGYSIQTTTPMVSLLRVPHGYTNDVGNVYDSQGNFINFPRELGDKSYYKDLADLSVDIRLDRQVVASIVHERRNYSCFHWIYETLPKLIYLSQNRHSIKLDKIYYHCGFWGTPYQRAALRNLGFNRFQLLDARRKRGVTAKELILLRLNEQKRNPSLDLCKCIKRAFVERDHPSPSRRLYLTRRNVKSGRGIINEDELLKLLTAYDFQTIDPGQLPWLKQIAYFNESQFIVSPHGAALANIVFCQPKTHVLELFNHPNTALGSQSYINISKTCDINLNRLPSKAFKSGMKVFIQTGRVLKSI
jgi:capsular polysaccharide biosynthesis protein